MNAIDLLITLILGLLAGLTSFAFFHTVLFTDQLRQNYPWIVYGIPVLFLLTLLLKKQTLYYPTKVREIHEMTEAKPFFWNRWMAFYHFLGASLSHLFGASVGREGVIVLTMTGISRLMNLNLSYWGPVAAAIGFAAITGNKWVGLVFLIELFSTNFAQKIWTFLGGWFALLLLETLKFQHLIPPLTIPDSDSFPKRFMYVLLLGMTCGYISRFYKHTYFYLNDFFKKSHVIWSLLLAAVLGVALYAEPFRPLQSLSLDLMAKISSGAIMLHTDFQLIIFKLVFTVLCLSLGFFGGEYVPLVVAGAGIGSVSAQYFGESLVFGLALSAFAFFAGVTRLRWTAMTLCLAVMGFANVFWIFFFYLLIEKFSADGSLYYENRPKSVSFNFANFQFRNFNQEDSSGPL